MLYPLPIKLFKYLLFAALFYACTQDLIGPQYNAGADVFTHAGRKVYLVNEGNFGWGNASISVYDPLRQVVQQRLFAGTNGTPPGDVAQQMREIDGNFYLVMNNSGKILVIDSSSFMLETEISGLASPRDICPCGNYLFVSLLYQSQLTVLDRQSLQQVGSVSIGSPGEQLYSGNGRLFVARPAGAIEIVNCQTLHSDTAFATSSEPGRFVQDQAGFLWTSLRGSWNADAALLRLDPAIPMIDSVFPTGTSSATRVSLSADSSLLWFLGGEGIYTFSISEEVAGDMAVVSTDNAVVYGFECDPLSGNLYYSDAGDFVQQSRVYRFSASGMPLDTFPGGIMTNSFLFP